MEEREVEKWDETNVEMNFFLFLSKKTQTKQIQVDFVDTELLFFFVVLIKKCVMWEVEKNKRKERGLAFFLFDKVINFERRW